MAERDELIGRRIAELRLAAGLTQEQLAGRAGMATENLSRAERGRTTPHLNKLIGIARALDVTLDELVEGRGTATEPRTEILLIIKRLGTLDAKTAGHTARMLGAFLDALEEDRRGRSE